MSKRQRIILTAIILSLGLIFIQTEIISRHYLAILILAGLSCFLSGWALREGLKGINYLAVLLLPGLFTAGVGLFYFLLPSQWTARIPVMVLYALGIYILLLTANIFLVASSRNIQLLRSAQATGFLLTLITAFFLFDTIFSFRFDFWLNFLAIFGIGWALFFQALWSVILEEKFSRKLFFLSFVLALILAEVVLAISFWPLTVSTSSLFLITTLYLLLGLIQGQLQERLFKKTVKEYLWVGIIVFLTIFFTTHWGG